MNCLHSICPGYEEFRKESSLPDESESDPYNRKRTPVIIKMDARPFSNTHGEPQV